MNIVISQPYFLPWVGLFEQLRLADVFVHYDDVQLPTGKNFNTRVQIKTKDGGFKWLSIPIQHQGKIANINEIKISYSEDWKKKHFNLIRDNYSTTPYYRETVELLEFVYDKQHEYLADMAISFIELIASYFGLDRKFVRSSELDIQGKSSRRLVDICIAFQATTYITGLGALKYIEYDLFEESNIQLQYMDYQKQTYQQLHGEFTPYVSIIDLIANCGKEGAKYICSNSVYWKDFIDGQN